MVTRADEKTVFTEVQIVSCLKYIYKFITVCFYFVAFPLVWSLCWSCELTATNLECSWEEDWPYNSLVFLLFPIAKHLRWNRKETGNLKCHSVVQIMLSIQGENPASAWGHNQKGANDHTYIINMTMALSTVVSVGSHINRGEFMLTMWKARLLRHINKSENTTAYLS